MLAVLEAEGRTFPVEAVFLEDVYRAIGYRLVRVLNACHRCLLPSWGACAECLPLVLNALHWCLPGACAGCDIGGALSPGSK